MRQKVAAAARHTHTHTRGTHEKRHYATTHRETKGERGERDAGRDDRHRDTARQSTATGETQRAKGRREGGGGASRGASLPSLTTHTHTLLSLPRLSLTRSKRRPTDAKKKNHRRRRRRLAGERGRAATANGGRTLRLRADRYYFCLLSFARGVHARQLDGGCGCLRLGGLDVCERCLSLVANVVRSPDSWKSAQIAPEKRIFTEAVFSKAFYSRECEHEIQLTPVYYFPGETVRIQCFMCHVALVLNGSPKKWARVANIDSFLEKGNKFGAQDGPDMEMVQNSEFLEDETLQPTPRKLGEPYYHQHDGVLIIENANSYSQGVYFCFDEDSAASQRHFHVLIPILPVVHVAKEHIDDIQQISGGCSDSSRSFPHHFWKDSHKMQLFDDMDTCFSRNGQNDWSCYDYRQSSRFPGCEHPSSSCRLSLNSSTLPLGTSLSISLRWSLWSQCESGRQQRTAHCFLSLDTPAPSQLPKKWDWLAKLGRLTDRIEFREGVPLFNGLLAGWLYKVDELHSCLDTELGGVLEEYDSFFVDVFKTILEDKDKLKVPENAFKYCFEYTKLDDKYDTLIGSYTQDRRAC